MTIQPCCGVASSNSKRERGAVGDGDATRPAFLRRCGDLAGWLAAGLPAIGVALLPKCPACLAAYIAAGTGVGLSVSTAGRLQILLMILCTASALWLAARRLRRPITLIFAAKTSTGIWHSRRPVR